MRYFFLAYLLAVVLVVGFAGFRGDRFQHTPFEILPDMDQQPKVRAQFANYFFSDGAGGRKPVTGTVPMGLEIPDKPAAEGGHHALGFTHGSGYYDTGIIGEFYGDGFPDQVTVDAGFLRLGQERYNINCAVCHGMSGNGAGVMSKYGIANIANFHNKPFFDATDPTYRPNGLIFEVISKGKGLMGAYGANIPVRERWAIVAWIRTMQKSRTAPLSDALVKAAWEQLKPVGPAPAAPDTSPPASPSPVAAN
jgi:mono/diheme cytochrome c family protein